MTKEDKRQLEPVLMELRPLINETDFMNLALIYMQRGKQYVIYGVDKDSIKNGICIKCYDIFHKAANGLVVITAENEPSGIKEWMASQREYQWYRLFTYDSIDELLLWIQRDDGELPYKYRYLANAVQKTMDFLEEREYGWWEKEDDEAE